MLEVHDFCKTFQMERTNNQLLLECLYEGLALPHIQWHEINTMSQALLLLASNLLIQYCPWFLDPTLKLQHHIQVGFSVIGKISVMQQWSQSPLKIFQ